MPYNIDFSGVADVNPYALAGWTYERGGARIVSGTWRSNWTDVGDVTAYYDAQAASAGVMSLSVTQNGDNQMNGDVVGVGWCDAAGSGYIFTINGGFLQSYALAAWQTSGSALGGATGQTYSNAAVFSAELDKDLGTMTLLNDGVAVTNSTLTGLDCADWKPVLVSSWDNTGARGVTSITVAGEAASNSAPVVNDQTFSVADSASNGTVIGTVVATDSDGTVDNYAISGTQLSINSTTGELTLADNTGLTAGTPITATVTVTDNDGDTDPATVTVNVTNSGLSFSCYDADSSNAAITSETLSHVRVLDPADLSEVATATSIATSSTGSAEIDTDSVTIGTDYLVIARRSNGDVCEPFSVTASDLAAS